MQKRVARSLALGILPLAIVACGGVAPDAQNAGDRARTHAGSPFPSRDSLRTLAATPVAAAPVQSVASAPAWNVVVDTSDAASLAEGRFAELVANSDARLTYAKNLRCVAREIARFQAEHGALPNERLRRFINAACNVTDLGVGALTLTVNATSDVSDAQILAEWQLTSGLPPQVKGNGVGVWMARSNTRAAIVIAFAKSENKMVVSPVDASGEFTVQGVAPSNSEYVLGLVNQHDGVATCEAETGTPPPLFSFRCAMASGDQTAWVEILTRAEGRLLMRSTGLGLARRDASAPVAFVASTRPPRPATSAAELQKAVLEGINQVRAVAKLSPVVLASTQTTTNERLAPHFFAASMKNDLPTSDLVGLGLLAGWDVDGTIKRGNLYASMLSGTTDANEWLDYALEAPMGRFTMLGPEARQVAIGVPTPSQIGGLGAIVTSYDMFTSNDHRGDAAVVFGLIQKARENRRLPPPTRMPSVPAMAAVAQLVNEGKRHAEDALDDALIAVRDHSRKAVRGWLLTANQLEALPLPPELLRDGPLDIAIEVTHHKPEGAAWGSYVVFVVTPNAVAPAPTPQRQASTIRAAGAL